MRLGGTKPTRHAVRSRLRRLLVDQHAEFEGTLQSLISMVATEPPWVILESFNGLAEMITAHRWIEDHILFTCYEDHTKLRDCGPTRILRQDHALITTRLREIADVLADTCDAPGRSDELTGLYGLLVAHHEQEEVVLYEVCEQMLDRDQRSTAIQKLLEHSDPTRRHVGCER